MTKTLSEEVIEMLPAEEKTGVVKADSIEAAEKILQKMGVKKFTVDRKSDNVFDFIDDKTQQTVATFHQEEGELQTYMKEAKMSDYYHVEPYASDSFYVEDAEGGDETGPFKTKKEAQAECDKRNKEYNK